MKVLIIAPYPPGKAPNQRFRFEQYLDALAEKGIEFSYQPFWSLQVWNIFYQKGHFGLKFFGLLSGIVRRFALLFSVAQYDYVFIHRECLPIGPPILEFLIAKVLKKRIIYDFDDAIWLENNSAANGPIVRWFKFHSKVKHVCRMSHIVVTGNHFLGDFAKRYNAEVRVIPTTIDTERYHNKIKAINGQALMVVGWTGTHSTLIQLESIENELAELQQKTPFELRVICNADPNFKKVKYHFLPWQQSTEIDDLLQFDIGLMPLRNTDWERGKCGFKGLQYMSLGIPCVASDVGANSSIFTHGQDGILIAPDKPKEWINQIKRLIVDKELRKSLGANGRETVQHKFSVKSNLNNYLRLFE
jgi:glycosyltransferase involved in cell wall biosynthesis